MSNKTCPSCGGQKATQINDREYRCEYCGDIFVPPQIRNRPHKMTQRSKR